jgi:SAM-dependent methyltransferase
LEIGSGSGYYSEVFSHMVSAQVSYVGLDYSLAMVSLAKEKYGPSSRFCVGDATRLPFRSGSFDVAFSGGVLLHVRDFRRAIAETRRVARYWAVFHVIPCVVSSNTSFVKKTAYGVEVIEVIFNQGELCSAFEECGLRVRERYVLEAYPVGLIQENAYLLTFACEVVPLAPSATVYRPAKGP